MAEKQGLNLNDNTDAMREILQKARTIAVVGHSDRPSRTSYQIGMFLRRQGYTVYAVNPLVEYIGEERCYKTLADLPVKVDIVNVFRRSEFLGEAVDEAIAAGAKTIWAQLGIRDEAAMQRAIEAGVDMAMDTCIKVDYMQLGVRHAS